MKEAILRIQFFMMVFLLSVISISNLHAQTVISNVTEKVDALFADWDNPNSPGCALSVIKDGSIVYTRGYGMADLEHDIPITSNTVFYIGSVSKQFVAMCILLLEEEGKLSLHDDIRKFLPEFPSYNAPIEVRHLIHHTSGIRDYFTLWRLTGNDYLDYMPEETVYNLICSQKELVFTPGEERLYSNSGYFLLSIIIRKVSGISLQEYARDKIFKVLGMTNSHFHDNNKHIIKNRAFGYSQLPEGGFANLFMRFDLVGSGGLYTTVEDLYLWDQNFYHNKLGGGGPDLIKKMLRKGKLNNGEEVNYAFALIPGVYRGANTVEHSGSLAGYRAHLLRFPDHRFSVVILSNFESFKASALTYQVADIYLEKELEPFKTEESIVDQADQPTNRQDTENMVTNVNKSIRLTKDQMEAYTGNYYNDELKTIYNVIIDKEKLYIQIKSNPKNEMCRIDKDLFKGFISIKFQRNDDKQVIGFTMESGRIKNVEFKRINF